MSTSQPPLASAQHGGKPVSSGEPEPVCRAVKKFRSGSAFGVPALPGSEIGVIFPIPWEGRCSGNLTS